MAVGTASFSLVAGNALMIAYLIQGVRSVCCSTEHELSVRVGACYYVLHVYYTLFCTSHFPGNFARARHSSVRHEDYRLLQITGLSIGGLGAGMMIPIAGVLALARERGNSSAQARVACPRFFVAPLIS